MGEMGGKLQSIVTGPIGSLISLAVLFSAVILMFNGANSWFLATRDAAQIGNGGERISRIVVAAGTEDSGDDAWFEQTLTELTAAASSSGGTDLAAGNWFKLSKRGTSDIGIHGSEIAATKANDVYGALSTLTYWTQSGTKLTNTELIALNWSAKEKFWDAGGLGTIVNLLIRTAALGLPVGIMMALAGFARNFTGLLGVSPILTAVMLVIGFSLLGVILNTLTPFIGDAFSGINSNRYDVYDGAGISFVATIVGNFWGVVLVGGILYIAWQAVFAFKNASNSGGGMFTSMAGSGRGRM